MHRRNILAWLPIATIFLLASAGNSQNRAQNSAQNNSQDNKAAKQDDLTLAVVIEKVISKSDPAQSYALYLPSTYTPTRKFPILYCFDPGARGAVPVTRFKEGAEKYNYIVVGSNNSRNFPNQPLSQMMRNLWDDTHVRFSIDERRVYLAGLSGGARVAISVAFAYKGVFAGVIACSAGYPDNVKPTTPRSFVIFETTGLEDFNNPEMQSLARSLEGSPPASRLVVFAGAHEWLPVTLAIKAIEWLELKAMQAGTRNKDEALIDDLFKKVVAEAQAAESTNDLYQAWLLYAGVPSDFRGLRDVTELEQKAATLKAAKEVREAIRQERRMEEEQERSTSSIQSLIDAMKQPENSTGAMAELKSAIAKQRKIPAPRRLLTNPVVPPAGLPPLRLPFFKKKTRPIIKKYKRGDRVFFFAPRKPAKPPRFFSPPPFPPFPKTKKQPSPHLQHQTPPPRPPPHLPAFSALNLIAPKKKKENFKTFKEGGGKNRKQTKTTGIKPPQPQNPTLNLKTPTFRRNSNGSTILPAMAEAATT